MWVLLLTRPRVEGVIPVRCGVPYLVLEGVTYEDGTNLERLYLRGGVCGGAFIMLEDRSLSGSMDFRIGGARDKKK